MYNTHLKTAEKYLLKYLITILFPLIIILIAGTASSVNEGANNEIPSAYPSDMKLDGNSSVEIFKPQEAVVVIDAGHGGSDWGASYGSVREKDLNLDMALKLGPLLENQNINVAYTREEDVFIGLKERAELANNLNASLFISIHNNKMPGDPKYKGTETLYSAGSNSRFDTMSDKRLAEIVQSELVSRLKTSDNGIIYRPELAVLRRTSMPAIIAEIGYISNSSDRAHLSSEAFRQKTAEALSASVVKALSEMGAYKDDNNRWMLTEIQR